MKKQSSIIPSTESSTEDLTALKAQMLDMQMEIDILKETINVLKKDPGVDQTALRNREKAVIIDALRNKYSLPKLCTKLAIPKSSYYYQEFALKAEDKSGIYVRISLRFSTKTEMFMNTGRFICCFIMKESLFLRK